jgi:hypothetical protein
MPKLEKFALTHLFLPPLAHSPFPLKTFTAKKNGTPLRWRRWLTAAKARGIPQRAQKRFLSDHIPDAVLNTGRRFIVVVSTSSMTNVVCLNVGIEMRVSLVVDFDPITADVAPGTSWHPYHVLSAFCNASCLGCWLEIEIQLSRLIRLSLRVQDRRLNRAIHKQCYPVHARLQPL